MPLSSPWCENSSPLCGRGNISPSVLPVVGNNSGEDESLLSAARRETLLVPGRGTGEVVGWFVADHYRHFTRQPDGSGGGGLTPTGLRGPFPPGRPRVGRVRAGLECCCCRLSETVRSENSAPPSLEAWEEGWSWSSDKSEDKEKEWGGAKSVRVLFSTSKPVVT